jgi:DMSO/TMAO reductase YedYZ heme-binding membrane subunit
MARAVTNASFGGPRLVGAYVFFVAGLASAVLAVPEVSDQEIRAVIRLTAFTSLVPFVLAFSASALARLWPSPTTRWLLAERRYVGLSFAASHAGHGLAIAGLAWHSPSFFANVSGATLVLGGLGYAFIAAMAATSTDAAQRALGRGWGILHTVGIYYLWLVFVFTYMGPAMRSPFHAVTTLALGAAWALRLAARGRASRRYALP